MDEVRARLLRTALAVADELRTPLRQARTDPERVARLAARVRPLGFALGVLAGAGGHPLLLARREPSGLLWMLELASECLRREDRGWAGGLCVPATRSARGDGTLGLACAALLLDGSSRAQRPQRPHWQMSASAASMLHAPALPAVERAVLDLLPGAEVRRAPGTGRAALLLPRVWFSGAPS